MAHAVARVILHEWIHIATQNSGHSSYGLTKARFGVDDLAPQAPAPSSPAYLATYSGKRAGASFMGGGTSGQ